MAGGEGSLHDPLRARPLTGVAALPRRLAAALAQIRPLSRLRAAGRARADEAVRTAALVRTVVENVPLLLWAVDAEGRFTVREGRALRALGQRPGSHIGECARTFWRSEYPEVPYLPVALDRALAGEHLSLRFRMRGRVFDVHHTPIRAHDGPVEGAACVAFDVTEQDAAERELRRSEARLDAVVRSAMDAIIAIDGRGRVVIFNEAAERMFGISKAEMLGRPLDPLIPAATREAYRESILGYLRHGEPTLRYDESRGFRGRRASTGEEFPIELTLSRTELDDGEVLATIVVRDRTEKHRMDTRLEQLAFYDQLTGLPNRALFAERLADAFDLAGREGTPFAVVLVDLDGFKAVNSALGQTAGDTALREVAARLRGVVREVDTVARLGGDEFGLLLRQTDAPGATQAADRVMSELHRPLAIGDEVVEIAASVGIAVAPAHGADVESLMRHADVALAHGKRSPGVYAVFEAGQDEPSADELILVAALRAAIQNDEIELAFQPIIRSDGCPLRVEALARWEHPVRGPIGPERFVALAERTGLMCELTRRVLGRAIAQIAGWRRMGIEASLAVNLSARDLADPSLPGLVAGLLGRHGIDPSALCLEITETALVSDLQRALPRLVALRELGVELAIDDFGTGYSSLAYLRNLPVSELKIDRSFVRQLSEGSSAEAIVRAAVSLGHDLRLRVVAEGAESDEDLQAVRALGCDAVQGWAIAHPLRPAEAREWLRERGMTAA